ncbi:fused signal recognition particle receptor [Desulfovibrio desulfuricans]|uniref:Signal recognition particle receptor FtsY n=2 Tax=Desulfovibrionaceae TaxID=194924 RepID=A0AA94L2X1_DESDE|nr:MULTISPECIES: signal recognition particle-docking protein FtsY [Desulfovibrio]SFW62391.1 fused signal recognition particle receptor [Desulfovibrio desulfuricans]SPD34581.1 Signal-recognition particle receptor FtsY [Desulfovibrio sp. G11]
MGFFSAIKKIFSTGTTEGQEQEKLEPTGEQVPGEVAAPEQSAAPSEATQPAPEQTGPEPGLEQAGSREYASEAPPMPHEEPAREVSVQAGSAPEHSGQESAAVEQPLSAGESAADMAHSTEADRVAGASSVSSPHGTEPSAVAAVAASGDQALTLRLREAEPRLSVWLGIVLEGVDETGDFLWQRLSFLLGALEAPPHEAQAFVEDFRDWTQRMDYRQVDEFRSELQYRLALALDLEDEEDERSRLFIKITEGLARTREQFARGLDTLFSGHGELDDAFWEELEELFIMADLGYEPSMELVERLKERARKEKVTEASGMRALLMAEVEEIFRAPRRIAAVNPPEVVLMIGVNGVGKTTTIAKLAHRARMQGKKVMIAAADTFRAAAIEQLQVWAERVGALFHAKSAGADPASVAYEAMDRAVREGVDILFVDTAGRLQTKVNLMEELTKIRQVLGKKHPGAPHRSILVIDATTGQNALSQTKLFKEAAGVDELILTKLDGTAKGGVAIAVAMQHYLPITFVGLGEKMEDLRPFNGEDYARALLGQKE